MTIDAFPQSEKYDDNIDADMSAQYKGADKDCPIIIQYIYTLKSVTLYHMNSNERMNIYVYKNLRYIRYSLEKMRKLASETHGCGEFMMLLMDTLI